MGDDKKPDEARTIAWRKERWRDLDAQQKALADQIRELEAEKATADAEHRDAIEALRREAAEIERRIKTAGDAHGLRLETIASRIEIVRETRKAKKDLAADQSREITAGGEVWPPRE